MTLLPPSIGTACSLPESGPGALIDRVSDLVQRARTATAHGPSVVSAFDHVETALIEVRHALAELEQFVVLDAAAEPADPMSDARRIWSELPAGRTTDPSALVAASPTLSALERAAVTVTSVETFTDEQLELARLIGAQLASYPQYAQSIAGTHPTFLVSPKAAVGMHRVLTWLESRGILTGSSLEFSYAQHVKPDTVWKILSGKPGTVPANARSFQVRVGALRDDYRAFLGGHWLTAYAGWIAADQFERLGVSYEVYTNVAYALPSDLGGGHSDIDVLIRAGELLVAIECKSGAVLATRNGPSAARKTAQGAERLESVFSRMDLATARSYQLLYIERNGETRDEIVGQLAAAGGVEVGVMTPDTIRVEVQELARRV